MAPIRRHWLPPNASERARHLTMSYWLITASTGETVKSVGDMKMWMSLCGLTQAMSANDYDREVRQILAQVWFA